MRRTLELILVAAILVTGALAMYSAGSPVTQLTAKDFDKVYKGVWMVEFYAPWCGHCQRLAPEYEKAAKALKGIAKIAAINADSEKTNVAIQGFPTIKFFVDGKMSDYNGERTAKGIVDFVLGEYKKIAYDRMGQKASSGGSNNGGGSSGGSGDDKDVVVLDEAGFDEEVLKDGGPWFVEFYAPWCGHCQRLAPEWAALATTLKGEVKVGKVDATENKELAGRFGVQGYPTIKFFPAGSKDDSSAVDYNGPRTEAGMAEWAREQTAGSGHFQHVELTSQKVYDQYCKAKNLCIISFLPHKLDSSPQERQRYLDTVKEAALKFRGKPFKFLWIQGGDHLEVEEKIGVAGVGYPSVCAIYQAKGLYGKMKKSFSGENIEDFLNSIIKNKAKFAKLVALPGFKTVASTADFAIGEAAAGSESNEGGCGEDLCTEPPKEEEPQEL